MCRFMLMRRQDIGVLLLHCLGLLEGKKPSAPYQA